MNIVLRLNHKTPLSGRIRITVMDFAKKIYRQKLLFSFLMCFFICGVCDDFPLVSSLYYFSKKSKSFFGLF